MNLNKRYKNVIIPHWNYPRKKQMFSLSITVDQGSFVIWVFETFKERGKGLDREGSQSYREWYWKKSINMSTIKLIKKRVLSQSLDRQTLDTTNPRHNKS